MLVLVDCVARQGPYRSAGGTPKPNCHPRRRGSSLRAPVRAFRGRPGVAPPVGSDVSRRRAARRIAKRLASVVPSFAVRCRTGGAQGVAGTLFVIALSQAVGAIDNNKVFTCHFAAQQSRALRRVPGQRPAATAAWKPAFGRRRGTAPRCRSARCAPHAAVARRSTPCTGARFGQCIRERAYSRQTCRASDARAVRGDADAAGASARRADVRAVRVACACSLVCRIAWPHGAVQQAVEVAAR